MNIAVIGSGLIGQAWAIVFARAGLHVRLWDHDKQALDKALTLVEQQLDELQDQQLVPDASKAMANITLATTLPQALEGAEYVQENLPEKIDVKRDIFAAMDALAAPETVLASSTSGIAASTFTDNLKGRQRCLVAHPVNPPYLIPVVEICGSPWTDPSVVQSTRALMDRVGQKPVTVNHEIEGFVLNRLQGALLLEAFRLVEQGVVSVEDLDATVKDGLGLRWSFMGPFETIDLNAPGGLPDYCDRYGPMYQRMAKPQQQASKLWSDDLISNIESQRRQHLSADDLQQRRRWRDEQLMALMRHKHVNTPPKPQE